MRGVASSFAFLLALLPCGCRSKPSPDGVPTSSASAISSAPAGTLSNDMAAVPATLLEGPPNSARLARCGWGSLKVEPGVDAPPWAIALVDIDVRHPTKGLRVTAVELAGSDVAAKSGERTTLRVQEGAVRYSFGAGETHEIDALLPVGSWRLRAASALDRPKKAILPRKPVHCTVVLSDAAGEQLVATGPLDPPWENE